MHFLLNITEALRAIRANFLRTMMTIFVIAIGLTALIGVLTSIDGIRFWFANSFVRLGANTFRIENYTSTVRDASRNNALIHSPIDYFQSKDFKEGFKDKGTVSAVGMASFSAQFKFQSNSTQANILLLGADPEFSQTDNFPIDKGRNLVEADLQGYRNVVVLGADVAKLLFPQLDPIGKTVYVSGKSYRVVGTFESIGSQGMIGGDKTCIIPSTTMLKDFPDPKRSFSLHVNVPDLHTLDEMTFEAVGVMRRVRHQKPLDENDFGIIKVDAILDNFMEDMRFLTWSATAIAIITLFSAAIGLMNNMLVSVTERTREIGVRMALGATRGQLMFQFLTEAVVITQVGGLLGTLMGILFGNLVGWLLGNSFMVPWDWVIGGIALCFVVGVGAGLLPARKASRVDPIESLRYE